MVTVMGWRDAYIVLGIGLLVVGAPLILWLLRERPSDGEDAGQLLGSSARTAAGTWSFWQLGLGFFVCGLTMSWVMTFFVDYALGQGISRETAAAGLSLMGGMSIAGSLMTGWWADRIGRRIPLAVVYALRGDGFALVLLTDGSIGYLFVAMGVIGFSWSATVPLTSALCADIYGRRSLGTVFGLMFAIMPIGAAAGSALGATSTISLAPTICRS
jgi:MFS family permease